MDKRLLAEDAVKFYRNFHGRLIHTPNSNEPEQASCGIVDSCGVEYLIQCRTAQPHSTKRIKLSPAFKNSPVAKLTGPHTSLAISSKSALIVVNFEKMGHSDLVEFVAIPIGKIYQYHVCIKDVEVVVKTNPDDAATDLAHIRLIA